jgi:hypothetical protein
LQLTSAGKSGVFPQSIIEDRIRCLKPSNTVGEEAQAFNEKSVIMLVKHVAGESKAGMFSILYDQENIQKGK